MFEAGLVSAMLQKAVLQGAQMGQAGIAVFKDSFGADSTCALYNLCVRSWDGRESVINNPG